MISFMQLFMIYILIINIITFCLYGIDKHKAKKKKWRISETTLLMSTFIGGSLGALLAMKMFHHKTKHWKFKILVPLFFIGHSICIYFLLK